MGGHHPAESIGLYRGENVRDPGWTDVVWRRGQAGVEWVVAVPEGCLHGVVHGPESERRNVGPLLCGLQRWEGGTVANRVGLFERG